MIGKASFSKRGWLFLFRNEISFGVFTLKFRSEAVMDVKSVEG